MKYSPVEISPASVPGWRPSLKALAREDLAAVTVRGYRSELAASLAWYEAPLEQLAPATSPTSASTSAAIAR